MVVIRDKATRPSGAPPYWTPGTQIAWHYRRAGWQTGDSEWVDPVTVVQDDDDGLAVWLPIGTPILQEVRADGRTIRDGDRSTMFTAPRIQSQSTWKDYDVLRIAPIGRPWSVWLFWRPGGSFDGYYVNLEAAQFEADAGAAECLVKEWSSPFCDGWEGFRPDPSWRLPALPADLA